jgi:hypothetical protein
MKRIQIEEKEGGKLFKIRAYYDQDKQKMLDVWLLAWTLCGLAIFSQVFLTDDNELRKMILIFGAFWIYFEYVAVKAWRWRKGGEEQIFIGDEEVQYGRTYYNRGILRPYRKDLINAVRDFSDEGNSFVKAFASSYWVIGGSESLAFTANGKVIPFGLDLEPKEAKKLMKEVNAELGVH